MLKIDTHTHIMPKQLPDWSSKLGYGSFIHLEHHREGAARMMQGDRFFREVMANCWDPVIRIEEYAQSGVQVQVVCTIPVLFAYFFPTKVPFLNVPTISLTCSSCVCKQTSIK
mgnify:CR=1 FL=1